MGKSFSCRTLRFDWVTKPGKCKECGKEIPLVSDGKPFNGVSYAWDQEQSYVKFVWICPECRSANSMRVVKAK